MKTLYEPTNRRPMERQNYCGTVPEQGARSQGKINDIERLSRFASGIGDNEGAPRELEGLLEALHGVATRVIRLEEDFSIWSYAPIEKSFGTVPKQGPRSPEKINDMGRLNQFASGIGDNEGAPTEIEALLEALEREETMVTEVGEDFFAWSYGLW